MEMLPQKTDDARAIEPVPPPPTGPAQASPPRRPSWLIILLPMIITVPWVAAMSLWKWAEDIFSIPGALAAGFLLSSVLLAIRRKGLPMKWALLPLLCWIYECLPITLPGPLDEILTVGGSGMDVFWAWVKKSPEK